MGSKAPKHLDMVGNTDLLNMAGLGFCGSRKSSPKGLETAQDYADQAARNDVSVVSGNAAGVDFEAHYNCLKAGGKTILVLPEGINHFRIKRALQPVWDWEQILVVSQFEPDEPWKAFRAMTRNQLIIALTRVMIVIEAGEKGGTLNAGKETLKSGLPLYIAQYQDMSDARGNQLLLDMGALYLAKSKLTDKANFVNVFESIKEDKLLKSLPQQADLL
jgi:DNA processing protein